MASKAPRYYRCPCCGSTFAHRRGKRCPQCDIPLHLEGEYMVEPCYLYLHKEEKWVGLRDVRCCRGKMVGNGVPKGTRVHITPSLRSTRVGQRGYQRNEAAEL